MTEIRDSSVFHKTRFAPTPSGYLHWGNAFSFVLTWLLAKQNEAKILLRIDDLDAARKRPEYVEDVFRSLDWLGLTYDEGPAGPDDFEANFSQRHRLDVYRRGLEALRQRDLIFGCDCSRATIQQAPDQKHPAACQLTGLPLDQENRAWRVATALNPIVWCDVDGTRRQIDLHVEMRDFIVRRRDLLPAYQLTSVLDDAHFGVDLVVRGEDLVHSTAAQIWLSPFVGGSFHRAATMHHAIVTDSDGHKLSKSRGDTSLAAIRETCESAAALYRQLSPLLGLNEPVESAEQALACRLSEI